MTSVYWIAHKDHTDIFSQGYVGVSNNVDYRWNSHKKLRTNVHLKNAINKYGWDNLVKKVVLIGEEDYCLEIENKLRPADKIGWNLVCGGGKPPVTLWNKGRKVPQDELAKLQAKGFGFKKGHNTWNAGVKLTPEQKVKQFKLEEYMKDKPRFFAGKSMPRHIIEAARQANIGKIQSDESNQKRSLANKGRKFLLVTCPNCSKTGGQTSMKRWHFDKCTGNKPYKARVTIEGKRIFLGNFETKDLATQAEIKAYKDANKSLPVQFIKHKGLSI